MPNETQTITLSEALDLIAQSKSDIKSSVQGKGGTINDNLTEYSSSIDEIPFNTLTGGLPLDPQNGDGSVIIKRYNSATFSTTDANIDDISIQVLSSYIAAAKPEGWSYDYYDQNAFTITLDDDGTGKAQLNAEYANVGWTQVKIHDNIGNVDFIKSYRTAINTNVLTISGVTENGNSATVTDNHDDKYTVDLAGGNDISITLAPVINDLPYTVTARDVIAAMSIYDGSGNLIAQLDGNPDTRDYVTVSNNVVTVNSSAIKDNGYIELFFGACTAINGEAIFDNYSSETTLTFSVSHTPQQNVNFTYDGADPNDPIQANVDLNDLASTSEISIGLNVNNYSGSYDFDSTLGWTPTGDDIPSDNNDFNIQSMGIQIGFTPLLSQEPDPDSGDTIYSWTNGPSTAGTYLKSYTLVFNYNSESDDEEAAQLDGQSITFYVNWIVTDSGTPK